MGDTNGNNTLKYVLPEVIDPPDTICVTLHIPNDPHHIMAFKGAMFDLACWWNWERDTAHRATLVARVWRKIFYAIKFGCDDQAQTFGDFEDMPRFRDACEHDLFYKGCDDTEHQIAFVGDIPASQTTAGGEPQPSPGGGSQDYCKSFNANAVNLIPALLNTGDIITVSSADGGGYDGGGLLWYCLTGDILFAECQPSSGHLDGGDPVPTANHMKLLIRIGANYYPIGVGSPLTVPGGVVNAQGWFQVNDSNLADNFGAYQICYSVQNNTSGTWEHIFDFLLANGGWAVNSDNRGVWTPGTGWYGSSAGGLDQSEVEIVRPMPSRTVTYFEVQCSKAAGAGTDNVDIGGLHNDSDPSFYNIAGGATVGLNVVHSWTGTLVTDSLFIDHDSGSAAGPVIIKKCIVRGIGTDPFL